MDLIGEFVGIDRTAILFWRSGHLLTPQVNLFLYILSLSGDCIHYRCVGLLFPLFIHTFTFLAFGLFFHHGGLVYERSRPTKPP